MKACLVFILFIGISLLLGCSRHYRSYPLFMEQAQSCVETAPDSALHYLSLLKDSIGCEPEETQMQKTSYIPAIPPIRLSTLL